MAQNKWQSRSRPRSRHGFLAQAPLPPRPSGRSLTVESPSSPVHSLSDKECPQPLTASSWSCCQCRCPVPPSELLGRTAGGPERRATRPLATAADTAWGGWGAQGEVGAQAGHCQPGAGPLARAEVGSDFSNRHSPCFFKDPALWEGLGAGASHLVSPRAHLWGSPAHCC